MDPSAQSLEAFLAMCKAKGISIAFITPTSGFLGSHLAEALLAQNLAVVANVIGNTKDSKAEYYTKHLDHNPHFFRAISFVSPNTSAVLQPQPLLEQIKPGYVLYDIDEALRSYATVNDFSFSMTVVTKQIVDYTTKNNAKLTLLSAIDKTEHEIFQPVIPNDPVFARTEKQSADIKQFALTLVNEAIGHSHANIRIIKYADIYGPRMELSQDTEVARFFQTVLIKRSIEIHGDGLTTIHPIYITDFIYGVIKSLFTQAAGKTYIFMHPQEVTLLQFAKELQFVASLCNIKLDVIFTNKEKPSTFSQHLLYSNAAAKELLWQPKVSLQEGLTRSISFFFVQPKAQPSPTALQKLPPEAIVPAQSKANPLKLISGLSLQPKAKPPEPVAKPMAVKPASLVVKDTPPLTKILGNTGGQKRRKPGLFKVVFTLVLWSITVSLAVTAAPYFIFKFLALQINADTASIAQAPATAQRIAATQTSIKQAGMVLRFMEWFYVLGHKQDTYAMYTTQLSFLDHTLNAKNSVAKATEAGNSFFVPASASFAETQHNLDLYSRIAYQNIALANIKAKQVSQALPLGPGVGSAKTILADTAANYADITNAAKLLRLLYQTGKEQALAFVAVDNTQLRPGGGLIGGVVIATFSPGKKVTLASFPVSDSRLSASIAPSKTYTQVTKQPVLSLQNSLWEPKFGDDINPFYNEIAGLTNKPLLGVIGVDFTGLQELLSLTGEVTLAADTNDNSGITVTRDTFENQFLDPYVRSQNLSTQDQGVVTTNLANTILTKVFASSQTTKGLVPLLRRQAIQQHVFFASHDQKFADYLASLRGPGPINLQNPNAFLVTDANIGDTRISTQVKKTIHQDLIINSKEEITERLIITYYNEASGSAVYKTFSRIFLPATKKITRITLDQRKPITDAITEDFGSSKAVGTTVTIPAGKSVTLAVEYGANQPLTYVNGKASVVAVAQKQNGVNAIPYEFAIRYPKTLQLADTAPKFDIFSDGILAKATIDQAKQFSATFTKP